MKSMIKKFLSYFQPEKDSFLKHIERIKYLSEMQPEPFLTLEPKGQQESKNYSRLPKPESKVEKAILESWGIVFRTEADDLFLNVVLPEGWQILQTDFYLESDLIDSRRVRRAGIFCKTAFHDRRAYINVVMSRFTESQLDTPEGYDLSYGIKDLAFDIIVQRFDPITYGYLTSDPSKVGYITKDNFYQIEVTVSDDRDTYVVSQLNSELATPISKSEFRSTYQDTMVGYYEVTDLVKQKAEEAAKLALKDYPQGPEQWLPKYDFEAV
jgi:hypothetical protein